MPMSYTIKAGARHSRRDQTLLQDMHDHAVKLGAACAPAEMKAVDPDRLDAVYTAYHDTVNMSASELERWAGDPASRRASVSRAPIDRNLRLLRKSKAEWTADDIRDANRTISFVSRMRKMEQGEPVNQEIGLSKRDISLRNWAFNPAKGNAVKAEHDGDVHPGAMLALMLSEEQQAAIAEAVGEEYVDEADHLTLVYLAPDAETITDQKNMLVQAVAAVADHLPPIVAEINGVARFTPDDDHVDDGAPLVLLINGVRLPDIYQMLVDCAENAQALAPRRYGFIPHVTLSYLDAADPTPPILVDRLPLVFDAISLVWAGQRLDFPLRGATTPDQVVEVEIEGDDDDVRPIPDPAATLPGDTATLDPEVLIYAPPAYAVQAVKSLGNGRIGAFTAIYGSPDQPDMSSQRDYFHAGTEFWLDRYGLLDGAGRLPMLYHHGMIDPSEARRLAAAKGANPAQARDLERLMTALRDDPTVGTWTKAVMTPIGIWLEGELDKRKAYAAAMEHLIAQQALALSSDSTAHLVKRVRMPNGTNRVDRWPIVASSLTPTPAEPRLLPVEAVKAVSPLIGVDYSVVLPSEGASAHSDRARRLSLELDLLTLEN